MESLREVGSKPAFGRKSSLARRLVLSLATMLLPLVVIATAGVLTFRSSVDALENFQRQTVDETAAIERTRHVLAQADDLGEAAVEEEDSGVGAEFRAHAKDVDAAFDGLATLDRDGERELALTARATWENAKQDLEVAAAMPPAGRTDSALDPFHDHIDEAGRLLGDLEVRNGTEVVDTIAALRSHQQLQLATALVILLAGSLLAAGLARRLRRSIAEPLLSLQEAAKRFGANDFSQRIPLGSNDEVGRVGAAFNTMADRLERSRSDLRHLALHDPLTDLANRVLFMERMQQVLARARRHGTPVAVLYFDLDGFKNVNDTLGHEAGDELLVAVSRRLQDCMRAEDTAARLGGDEFGAVLEDCGLDEAIAVADRLSRTLMDPVPTAHGEVRSSASIGIAIRDDEEDVDELLRHADAAMYAAKTLGTGSWQLFDSGTELVRPAAAATGIPVGA